MFVLFFHCYQWGFRLHWIRRSQILSFSANGRHIGQGLEQYHRVLTGVSLNVCFCKPWLFGEAFQAFVVVKLLLYLLIWWLYKAILLSMSVQTVNICLRRWFRFGPLHWSQEGIAGFIISRSSTGEAWHHCGFGGPLTPELWALPIGDIHRIYVEYWLKLFQLNWREIILTPQIIK